jgi:hypothetical protein
MQSNCPAAKDRSQFLFFFEQRRRKFSLRRDPVLGPGCNPKDDLICGKVSDKASIACRIENARSRLGWGITHI